MARGAARKPTRGQNSSGSLGSGFGSVQRIGIPWADPEPSCTAVPGRHGAHAPDAGHDRPTSAYDIAGSGESRFHSHDTWTTGVEGVARLASLRIPERISTRADLSR